MLISHIDMGQVDVMQHVRRNLQMYSHLRDQLKCHTH